MATVTKTDSDVDTGNLTTYSFTCTIGADGGGSLYFVIGGGMTAIAGTPPTFSAVTVDGVTPSTDVTNNTTSGTGITIGIFSMSRAALPTPANTTVTLSVTFATAMLRAAVDTYVSTDAKSTVKDTATGGPQGAGAMTLDLDTGASGIVLGGGMAFNPATWAWTGATEQTDTNIESAVVYTSACESNVVAATPRAVTAEASGGTNATQIGASASFDAQDGRLFRAFFVGLTGLGGTA